MTTPARQQYLSIKKSHQGDILLFRMGDFFETFDDDARLVSRELEIALTSREMGRGQHIPLAGIPYHALEPYLAKLIRKGHRVAICEQTSDPATSKGLVERAVVRVVTPGTVIEDSLLEQGANNFLASVIVDSQFAGVAYTDITTGEFATTQMSADELPGEIGRLSPSEILIPDGQQMPTEYASLVTSLNSGAFDRQWSTETLMEQFGVTSLEPFGCDDLPLATRAAGAVIEYLRRNQKAALGQLKSLHTYSTTSYMTLDTQTRRNLELFEGGRWRNPDASLLSILDNTRTPVGRRLLRKWLGQPLLDINELLARQDAVAWFHRNGIRRDKIISLLESMSDIERIINRVCARTATPRDLVGLEHTLSLTPQLRILLTQDGDADNVDDLASRTIDNKDVVDLVGCAISDDPPASVGDGQVIRKGFSPDLDTLRNSSLSAKSYIAKLEHEERERTGIKNLKVGYNKVFGYYIEISKSNLEHVPDDYVRRQTLVGGERYITSEMKEYESLILNAQDQIDELENSIFRQVCQQVGDEIISIMTTAKAIAEIDVYCSLGEISSQQGYVKPDLDESDVLEIVEGRHPVVEQSLPAGDFVPNSVRLSASDEQLIILTGPNMSGKSTYIRQIATIVLMAQIGSFVPARSARIGIVDRIFTRVGLQDDLAEGQSTFMIEMVETASILNHATPRSLLILDEIGRGTSTYDGLAIARAIAEYIHNHPRLGCKTLFATHYHELVQLAKLLPRVRNYNVAVSEENDEVIFLRKIVQGGADKSYGVHVAQLAGLPGSVITRAWDVLRDLESAAAPLGVANEGKSEFKTNNSLKSDHQQLSFLPETSPVIKALLDLDIASMTPLEAITKLYELQEKAGPDN